MLKPVKIASFILVFLFCLGSLIYGLLAGVLAACLGYAFASFLEGKHRVKGPKLHPMLAAAVVIIMPIIGIVFFSWNAKGMALSGFEQYQSLLHHLAGTILELREKLPKSIGASLPTEMLATQKLLSEYLKTQSHYLTNFGTTGLHGLLLAYVGLVVGALIKGTPRSETQALLRFELRQRASHFYATFLQIVVAQFWIAAFNAFCTMIFLLVILPLFNTEMPYAGVLIAFTFFAGLIPIVGNLLCNGILTIAGVSISPTVGLACLVFLISIHKFEYVINAKVIGTRTNTAAWELLAAMFIGEAIFGVSGLVAAPLYYAYVKKELQDAGLV